MFGLNAEIGHILGLFNEDNPMTVNLASIILLWFMLSVWFMLVEQVKRWHCLVKSVWWVTINLVYNMGNCTIWLYESETKPLIVNL